MLDLDRGALCYFAMNVRPAACRGCDTALPATEVRAKQAVTQAPVDTFRHALCRMLHHTTGGYNCAKLGTRACDRGVLRSVPPLLVRAPDRPLHRTAH